MSNPEKKTDPPVGPHDAQLAHDKDHKGKHAAKPYDGPNRRVSGVAERRLADPATTFPPAKYPAWRYHETDGSQIVQTQAQDEALGKGWSDKQPEAADDSPVRRMKPGQAKEF